MKIDTCDKINLAKEGIVSDSGDKFLYFLVGASIGSAFALLFAPKSGQETREELTRRAQESRDYVTRTVEKSRGYLDEGSSRISNEVTSLVDRSKEEATSLIDKGKDMVQEQKEQFTAAFEAGREAYLQDRDSE